MSRLILGTEKPDPIALQQMRERTLPGDSWSAWQNVAMDSADLGHLQFILIGPTRTFKKVPDRCPDTHMYMGWKYVYVGTVNLETGEIQ